MMPRHARRVNAMPRDVLDYLMFYFRLRGPRAREAGWLPSVSLAERGYGQADVVLALLRADDRRFLDCAESLVGHRIARCPPCLRATAESPSLDRPRSGDLRRIVSVSPNPRLPTTPAWHRYRLLSPGRTVQQFLVRGGRRVDLRLALRRGWIQLEDAR